MSPTPGLARDLRELVEGRRPTLCSVHRQPLIEELCSRLERGRSLALAGREGVGRSTVVRALARRLREQGQGRVVELPQHLDLYAVEWDRERLRQGPLTVLWAPGEAQLLDPERGLPVGLVRQLQAGGLAFIAEVGEGLRPLWARWPALPELVDLVELRPLPLEAALEELGAQAVEWGLQLEPAALERLGQLCLRFQGDQPLPASGLGALEGLLGPRARGRSISAVEVEQAFSASTGLQPALVGRDTPLRVAELSRWFEERIVGQRAAIEQITESLVLWKAGLAAPDRPPGTFLFAGPSEAGKNALSNMLATWTYGSPSRLGRVDLGLGALQDLLRARGDVGLILHRLRQLLEAQPHQVLLLEQLHLAPPELWPLLERLLMRGELDLGGGRLLRRPAILIIATVDLHLGELPRPQSPGAVELFESRLRETLESSLHPAVFSAFHHVITFQPLSPEQQRVVAREALQRLLDRSELRARGVGLQVEDAALDLALGRPEERSRSLEQRLSRHILAPIAHWMAEGRVDPQQLLVVGLREGRIRVRVADGPAPAALPASVEGRGALSLRLARQRERISALAQRSGEGELRAARSRLLVRRRETDFWREPAEAARALEELDRITQSLDRLDRLRGRADALDAELRGADTQPRLERCAQGLEALEAGLEQALREMEGPSVADGELTRS
jgi:ATP-dependent Clp protease ATP-binding subunit ClpC